MSSKWKLPAPLPLTLIIVYSCDISALKVNKLPSSDWVNVFHFSSYPSPFANGDRIPALFIHNDGHFQVCFSTNGDRLCNLLPFDVGTWYKIKIKQYKSCGKYWYEIMVDDAVKFRTQNNFPHGHTGLLWKKNNTVICGGLYAYCIVKRRQTS